MILYLAIICYYLWPIKKGGKKVGKDVARESKKIAKQTKKTAKASGRAAKGEATKLKKALKKKSE